MKFVIGIDGGGTKSIGCIADKNGNILGQIKGGSLNFHSQGQDCVKNNLDNLITDLIHTVDCKMNDIEIISMGIAGIGRERDKENFLNILSLLNITSKLLLTTDIQIALVGAHGAKNGIFTLSGTGSIAYGIDSLGREYRVGGWGHKISDEGSGYDIGRKALMMIAKIIDDREKEFLLKDMVFEHFKVENIDDFIAYVYSPLSTKADIASVAEIVHYCALKGDMMCFNLLKKASKDLADLTIDLLKKIPEKEKLSVSVGGGIFDNMQLVYDYFVKYLLEYDSNITLSKPKYPPVIGALILGFKQLDLKFNISN